MGKVEIERQPENVKTCRFNQLMYGEFFETDNGHVCIRTGGEDDDSNFIDFDGIILTGQMDPFENVYPLNATIKVDYVHKDY